MGDCDDESSTYYVGITTTYSTSSYITIKSSLPTDCGTIGTGYGSSGYGSGGSGSYGSSSYYSYHSSSNLIVIIVPVVFCIICIIILAIVIAIRNKRRLNRAKNTDKKGKVRKFLEISIFFLFTF